MHHKFRTPLFSLLLSAVLASVATTTLQAKSIHSLPAHADHHAGASSETLKPLQDRTTLLKQAEAALAAGQLDQASADFERAGVMLHAADAEMGLIRTMMQAGDYPHALAFAAHTAGAHLDEPEGAAMYAWLLQLGGQDVIAQNVLKEALARQPKHPLLTTVQAQLAAPFPIATGILATLPTRFAPYSLSSGAELGVPPTARVVGTGVLIDRGQRALVPLASVRRGSDFWVRNGLGQLAKATIERRLKKDDIAILHLAQTLPFIALEIAPKEAFPGSVAYTIEYAATSNSAPAWPMLSSGFLGLPQGGNAERRLGIELPKGPRGGPVFDVAGRLTGMAHVGKRGEGLFIPAARLQASTGDILWAPRVPTMDQHMALDQIYASGLRIAVQVIVGR